MDDGGVEEDNIYDEVEIEDLEFEDGKFFYPCPCGDKFQISLEQLRGGETIATCPSCSLKLMVIYEADFLESFESKQADVY